MLDIPENQDAVTIETKKIDANMPEGFAELFGNIDTATQETTDVVEVGIQRVDELCSTINQIGKTGVFCSKLEECFSYNSVTKQNIADFNNSIA